MSIIVGSARHDENGTYSGGAAGDSLQKSSTGDTCGEVSMQAMYTHSKGWYILRPIAVGVATKLANAMITACNNANIGYDQGNRLGIMTYGIKSSVKTEADCSSLVRACIKFATNVDVGNFTTINELKTLVESGIFSNVGAYVNQTSTPVYNGDVLVTKTKGHTVIVVSGNPRGTTSTSTVPSVAVPTVKKGTTGTQAKYLQQDLNYVASAGLAVDGDFGTKSVAALKKWQAAAGLEADGSYGPKSYAVMKNLIK